MRNVKIWHTTNTTDAQNLVYIFLCGWGGLVLVISGPEREGTYDWLILDI